MQKLVDEYLDIMTENNLFKAAAKPMVENKDEENPRISKFGGSFPLLPEEEYLMHCDACNSKMISCVQLYVPQLPEYFKNYFPKDKRNCLLVLTLCARCKGLYTYKVSIYNQDQLDYLMFVESNDKDNVFKFEPRVIKDWEMFKMIPKRYQGNTLDILKLHKFDYRTFGNDEVKRYNNTDGTHLGGWPDFVQRDETPIGMSLLLEMEQSESATMMWGDSGTAQLWMSTGDDFGDFKLTWACC